MKRLFIGVPIESPKTVKQVEVWKNDEQLNRNVLNWTIPENWHITLFFLGNTDESEAALLQQLIDESFRKIQPYRTDLHGVGVFPNTHNPKVLWIGLQNIQPLMLAFSKLGELLQKNGFSFDQKPLKPHLTIARVKRAENPLAFHTLLSENQEMAFDQVNVNKVVLFESITNPSGPIYKPLFERQLIR